MAGLWCVNAGHGRREIADAMAEQAGRLGYYHGFAGAANEPAVRLAAKLLELAPVPMARVFFASSGSEANDTQLKLVWHYNNLRGKPDKKKIIARRRGYHGVTVAPAALTGLPWCTPASICRCPASSTPAAPHTTARGQPGESEDAYAAGSRASSPRRSRARGRTPSPPSSPSR